MIGAGHRRICCLTLGRLLDATVLGTRGYADARAEAGIAYDPDLVPEADVARADPEAEVRVLSAAIDRVLALPDPPTALCLGNDRMAVRANLAAFSDGIGIIPSTTSAAAMSENYAEGGPLEVLIELSRQQALVRPVTPGQVVAAKVFEKARGDIANGANGADVADTLDPAVDEIDADIQGNEGYGP